MNNHILVFPFEPDMLSEINNKRIIVKTSDLEKFPAIINYFNYSDNTLYGVILNTNGLLFDDYFFDEETIKVCNKLSFIFIYSSKFGSVKNFLRQLSYIKKIKVKIFLQTKFKENFVNLKILSSLGIPGGVLFDENIDWDELEDLMIYSVYSRANHVPIEPFNHIISNYRPNDYTDFSRVYFNDPQKFLHINKNEEIALSYNQLKNGLFIDKGIKNINNIANNKKYHEYMNSWKNLFLERKPCSSCPAYRICLGKFFSSKENIKCKKFFSELLEAANFFINHKPKKNIYGSYNF